MPAVADHHLHADTAARRCPARGLLIEPQAQVLILDDHPLVAVAIRAALRRNGLVARYVDPSDGATLDQVLVDGEPGLAVLDLDLAPSTDGTPLDGVTLIPRLRSAGWRVLLLTGSHDRSRIAAGVVAGALGWLAKSSPFEQLVTSIRAAAGGAEVLDPVERAQLISEHHAVDGERADLNRRWARLTRRELEIVRCLAAGRRVAQIAGDFVVSQATVRTQIRSILAKLEVTSQLEAAAIARRMT